MVIRKIFLSFLAVPAGPCLFQKSREPLGFLVMRHVGGRFEPYQLLAFRGIKAIKVSPGQKTRGDLVVSTLNEEYGDIQGRNLMKETRSCTSGRRASCTAESPPSARIASFTE